MPVPDRVVESGMSEEIDEAFISIVFLVVQAQTFFSTCSAFPYFCLLAVASNLLAMASNLLAVASNLLAMASNILAMA